MMPSFCSMSATSRCSGSICGVVHLLGELLRAGDGFLGFFRVLVDVHASLRLASVVCYVTMADRLRPVLRTRPDPSGPASCRRVLRTVLQFLQRFEMRPLLRRQLAGQLDVDRGIRSPCSSGLPTAGIP